MKATDLSVMSDPEFNPIDLTEFLESGILLKVNEEVLWPLGLALTVSYDIHTNKITRLFVSEWSYPDGHQEIIESVEDDVMTGRHAAFEKWVRARAALMPDLSERGACLSVLGRD